MNSREWLVRLLSGLAVAACGLGAQAGEDTSTYVKLTASQKQDAFYTGTWWSDGKIPHADANYSNAGKGLRTTSAERAAARSPTLQATRCRPPNTPSNSSRRAKGASFAWPSPSLG